MSAGFLQSSEWEFFQNSLGRKTWRAGGALVIQHQLPAGFNYLYCPRPVFLTSGILEEAAVVAESEKSVFLKIEPEQAGDGFLNGWRAARGSPVQPPQTAIIELSSSEDAILGAMREKTRYNIRLAERRGVKAEKADFTPSVFRKFWELLAETSERENFRLHPRKHYEKLFEIKSDNFVNEMFSAVYRGEVAAAAIVNFYRPAQTAVYLHGASSRAHKEVMAPYLLHWRVIAEAKKRGFKFYDLWGVDENKWPGITRFKRGFGGRIVRYPPATDVIYRPLRYFIYQLARKIY